jgi:broad specificity phosphatase PhoE
MSSLTLVRHGQASFFADDYDRLSALGQTQAQLLGEYWAHRGVSFDEVYSGPRTRQRQTADLAGARCAAAGLPWPEPVVLAELDEFDLDGLRDRLVPELARESAAFAELVDGFRRSAGGPEHARNFQRVFEALTVHWLTVADIAGLESWPAFRERVRRALRRVTEGPGRGRRVALFTSGGFIGTAVQLALGAPDRAALELSWRLRNGGVTEFVFSGDRLSLDAFNAVGHLEDPELWTYR